MKTNKTSTISPELISNIFNGSIVLISICLAIITLFQVTNKSAIYIVDELMSITVEMYLFSMIFAYRAMQKSERKHSAKLADIIFIAAIVGTVISCAVLVYEFQKYA